MITLVEIFLVLVLLLGLLFMFIAGVALFIGAAIGLVRGVRAYRRDG